VGVWVAFTALVSAARLVGHGLPESAPVHQLHLSDCALPCWIGIVPGATSASEAMRYLLETFPPGDNAHPRLPSSGPTTSVWIEMTLPIANVVVDPILVHVEFVHGITNRIMIQGKRYGMLNTMPRVGDVVRLFGPPSCVNPQAPGFEGWMLFYQTPGGTVVIGVLGRDSISWAQPVYFLYVRNAAEDSHVCSASQPWRGVYRSHYQQHS
jgi:hypothetical protein